MKTRITELFGIEYPIIIGGMLWLATPELCAAISNAGGLGNITACNYDTGEEFRQAIHRARELTSKPIGINITLLPSMRFTDEILMISSGYATKKKLMLSRCPGIQPLSILICYIRQA